MRSGESRKFSWQVGAALLLIGAIGAWQGRAWGSNVVLAGVVLAAVGSAAPRLLVPFWRVWQRLGDLLNRVVSPVMLTLLYIVVVTPMGVLRRTLGRSPLSRDPDAASYWVKRDRPADDSGDARRRRMRLPY